jgi:hypothetical protein
MVLGELLFSTHYPSERESVREKKTVLLVFRVIPDQVGCNVLWHRLTI